MSRTVEKRCMRRIPVLPGAMRIKRWGRRHHPDRACTRIQRHNRPPASCQLIGRNLLQPYIQRQHRIITLNHMVEKQVASQRLDPLCRPGGGATQMTIMRRLHATSPICCMLEPHRMRRNRTMRIGAR